MQTPTDEALTELAARREHQGVFARVYVHDGMNTVMIHRDGDTTATVDEALEEGPALVGELATQIAEKRNLPEDWLSLVGSELPAASAHRRPTVRERMLQRVLHTAARLAERCMTVARQPDANTLKKRCALAVVRIVGFAVELARRLISKADRDRLGV